MKRAILESCLRVWLVVGGDGGGNDCEKAEVKGFIKLIK